MILFLPSALMVLGLIPMYAAYKQGLQLVSLQANNGMSYKRRFYSRFIPLIALGLVCMAYSIYEALKLGLL